MADNLTYPILFDLQKGVDTAIKDWDSKYADKLEKAIQKRALGVKLKFDTKAFDNLDDVKRRLAELKITPLTPENKKAIQDLTRELKGLAQLMEKISNFKGIELPELQAAKAAKLRKDVAQADEKLRLSKERVRQAEERLILSQQRAAQQAKNTGKAFGEQEGYLSNLIKKMAVYASFRQVGNFLTSVREVTAQFELQRVSLGAILQDANKGEQIFSQIKQFALNSPLSILDMTRYTKQLAAYKIEYDELFEMTKRFADISVGLGVDYQRIVLAAGQTRTATYLRASELKQFTELGVPLLEELSIKLSKMNGEMVSTAEVMDMISKRAISWELVKEVLYDMTDAGGMFYNMQIQQGNTLYGLWQKLGDAASVMYEQIGNTGWVNSGMKEAIQLLTELMRNWKAVGLTAATTVLPAVAAMAAWKMATKSLAKTVTAATNERIIAEAKLATAMKGTDIAAQNAARSTLAKAKADEAAAIAAQKHTTALGKLKMGLVSLGKSIVAGLGIGIAITLITQLTYKFYEALTNFRKLKNELGSIYTETATLQDQSVRNFEFLADKAVKAANGSKEQTDALQELNRTYRDILPQEALTIENLTNLKGKYDALTQSIKEYIAEQQRQKAESSIFEYYGTKIRDAQGDVRDRLFDQGLSANEVGRFFAEFEKVAPKYGEDVWGAFQESMIAAGVKDKKRIAQIWKKEFEFTQRDIFSSDTGNANIRALSEAYANQANELKGMNEQYRESIGNLGKFADMQKRVSDTVANATYKTTGDKPIDTDKQGDLLDAMKFNLWVKQTATEIQNSEDIKKAFAFMGEGIKSEWFNIIDTISSNDLGKVSQINFDAIIAAVDKMITDLGNKNPEILTILNTFRNYLVSQKKQYENMAPSETVIVRWRNRWREIVKELQISGQNMNRFLMQSSEDFEAYRKRIKEEVTAVINQINILNEAIKARISARAAGDDKYTKEQEAADKKKLKQAEERKKALQKLLEDLDKIDIETGKKDKGSKSDTRLQVLQEVAQTLSTINKEYDDLAKKEGASKALADIKERFKDVLAYTNKIGGKFGLNFGLPTEFKTLQEYRNAILNVMQSLKGLPKGSEKTILDFKTMIGKADSDYLQKQIEQQLKTLADRISRTKTAKEFYEKILDMTGDIQLSANLAVSVYGQNGQDLQDAIREQIKTAFETDPEKNITIDLSEAIDPDTGAINYNKLAELEEKYKDVLISGRADLRQKLIDEGRKTSAAQVQQWLKDIEKAKDFAQQRIDLATYTANQIAAINARTDLPQADKDKLTKGYQDREAKQLAKLQYDEFKDSAMYVHIFEDLDHASTTALKNMRDRLIALKGQWLHLDPTQVKELTKAIADLDEQIAGRSPFKSILDGFKGLASARPQKVIDAELLTATEELTRREEALTTATKKYTEAQTAQLNAQAEVAQARQDLEDALAVSGGEETAEVKAAREVLGIKIATFNAIKAASADSISAAKTEVDKASEKYEEQKKVIDKLVEEGKIREANIKKIELSIQKIDEYQQQVNEALGGIRKIMEAFGASDEDMQFFDDVTGALNEIVDAGQQAEMSVASFMSGNILGGITSGISAIGGLVSGFTNLFYAGRVKRANKEIKRQQELLDQLDYTYGRLEKAADKAFGADFVANQKQQQKILLAQQQAYMKQYEAEMSKGKKADKEKAQEFLDKARDVGDQIADMQGKIAEQMAGTDVASAARDFASAWLEAYASFGNTTDAIREKFNDMIKNMIVESVMAKTVQMALQPMFDEMDKMYKSGASMTDVLSYAFSKAGTLTDQISNGLEVNAKYLESLGINIRDLYASSDNLKGIAKEVSSASSEEINQLSAFVNTALYYVSPIPTISENVALIRQLMERGTTSTLPDTTAAGWTDWERQAMDNYKAIAANTAATVVECRRAANACEAATEKLNRIIVTKGGKFAVNTTYV